jgi:CxxC motif-containing protein (DUF1111 family)
VGGLVALPGIWLGSGTLHAADPDETLAQGRELFAREWIPNDARSHGGDGLGPVFNDRSCLGCHHQGGAGGGSAADKNIEIITATPAGGPSSGPGFFSYAFGMSMGADGFQYRFTSNPPAQGGLAARNRLNPADLVQIHAGFREASSVVLHRYASDPDYRVWRERTPGQHGAILVRTSQRNPTPLFGVGLIDAIPDEVLEAAAQRRFPGWPQIKGRVSRLPDDRIGRFGWKAQTATLREFVDSAAARELGLEVPRQHQAGDPRIPALAAPGLDMTQDECDALLAYVRSLPAPVAREPDGPKEASRIKNGKATFKAIGCANCHVPKLGDVAGIYSDLLLHDMSPQLSDTGFYGIFTARPAAEEAVVRPAVARGAGRRSLIGATLQEWRTPPLWGLRDSAPYLHNGRAQTLEEAIALHGGQGAAAAQRFARLSTGDRLQLETFLLSLTAPAPDVPPGRQRAAR